LNLTKGFLSNLHIISEAGKSFDYSKFEGIVKQNYADLKSEVFSNRRVKYTFINEAAALWTYIGSVTLTFKNGGELKVEPFAITMLFKKLNEIWKVRMNSIE